MKSYFLKNFIVFLSKKNPLEIIPANSLSDPFVESINSFYTLSNSKSSILSSSILQLKTFCYSIMFASSKVGIIINYSILPNKMSSLYPIGYTPSVIKSYRSEYFSFSSPEQYNKLKKQIFYESYSAPTWFLKKNS